MKNPDNKPLRIVDSRRYVSTPDPGDGGFVPTRDKYYGLVLSNLAVAQSNLVLAGKSSGLTHFIAIVKELEKIYGFKFEIMEEPNANSTPE